MATAFSDPNLYFRIKPVNPINWDLTLKAMNYKQGKYDEGKLKVDRLMDKYLSFDIDKKPVKDRFINNLNMLASEINAAGMTDFSDSNITSRVMSHISQALDEPTVHAINISKQRRETEAMLQELMTSKSADLYSDVNRQAMYLMKDKNGKSYTDWLNDGDANSVWYGNFNYTPYYDYEKAETKALMDLLKFNSSQEVLVPGVDSNGNLTGIDITYTGAGLTADAISRVSQFMNNPKKQQQMMLEGIVKYQGFNEEGLNRLKEDYTTLYGGQIAQKESDISLMEARLAELPKDSEAYKEGQKTLSLAREHLDIYKNRLSELDENIGNNKAEFLALQVISTQHSDALIEGMRPYIRDPYIKKMDLNPIWKFNQEMMFKNQERLDKLRMFDIAESNKFKLKEYELLLKKQAEFEEAFVLLDAENAMSVLTTEQQQAYVDSLLDGRVDRGVALGREIINKLVDIYEDTQGNYSEEEKNQAYINLVGVGGILGVPQNTGGINKEQILEAYEQQGSKAFSGISTIFRNLNANSLISKGDLGGMFRELTNNAEDYLNITNKLNIARGDEYKKDNESYLNSNGFITTGIGPDGNAKVEKVKDRFKDIRNPDGTLKEGKTIEDSSDYKYYIGSTELNKVSKSLGLLEDNEESKRIITNINKIYGTNIKIEEETKYITGYGAFLGGIDKGGNVLSGMNMNSIRMSEEIRPDYLKNPKYQEALKDIYGKLSDTKVFLVNPDKKGTEMLTSLIQANTQGTNVKFDPKAAYTIQQRTEPNGTHIYEVYQNVEIEGKTDLKKGQRLEEVGKITEANLLRVMPSFNSVELNSQRPIYNTVGDKVDSGPILFSTSYMSDEDVLGLVGNVPNARIIGDFEAKTYVESLDFMDSFATFIPDIKDLATNAISNANNYRISAELKRDNLNGGNYVQVSIVDNNNNEKVLTRDRKDLDVLDPIAYQIRHAPQYFFAEAIAGILEKGWNMVQSGQSLKNYGEFQRLIYNNK